MKLYNYNQNTKEFISESTATENPLEKGNYLIPANATTVKPLIAKEGFAVCFNEDLKIWEYLEDNRGIAYNVREEVKIDYLGKLKEGSTKEPIPFTQAELDAQKIAEAKAYLAATDFKVLPDYDQDSTEVKVKRQEAREFIRANEGDN